MFSKKFLYFLKFVNFVSGLCVNAMQRRSSSLRTFFWRLITLLNVFIFYFSFTFRNACVFWIFLQNFQHLRVALSFIYDSLNIKKGRFKWVFFGFTNVPNTKQCAFVAVDSRFSCEKRYFYLFCLSLFLRNCRFFVALMIYILI